MFNILNEGFERKYLYENELDPIKKEVRRVLKNEGYDVTTDDADKLITEAAEYINYTRTVGGNSKFSASQWLREAKECADDEDLDEKLKWGNFSVSTPGDVLGNVLGAARDVAVTGNQGFSGFAKELAGRDSVLGNKNFGKNISDVGDTFVKIKSKGLLGADRRRGKEVDRDVDVEESVGGGSRNWHKIARKLGIKEDINTNPDDANSIYDYTDEIMRIFKRNEHKDTGGNMVVNYDEFVEDDEYGSYDALIVEVGNSNSTYMSELRHDLTRFCDAHNLDFWEEGNDNGSYGKTYHIYSLDSLDEGLLDGVKSLGDTAGNVINSIGGAASNILGGVGKIASGLNPMGGKNESFSFKPAEDYNKVTYTVCDMTTGKSIGSYDTDMKAQVAARKYAMNNRRKASAVDSNFDVIATYDYNGSEIFNKNYRSNESLSKSIKRVINRLNEAEMSPEDKRDTQLLWKVFDKYNTAEYGTTPKLTSAEKSVLKRYGVSPYYKAKPKDGFDEYTNQATLVKGQGDDRFPLTRKNAVGKDTYITQKNRDKYNLADKARKMDVRGNRGYLGSMGVDRTNKWVFNPRLIDVERDYQNQQMQKPVDDMKTTLQRRNKQQTDVDNLLRRDKKEESLRGKRNMRTHGTAIAEDFDERNLEKRGTSEYEANHNRHRRIDMYRKYANLTEDEEITEDNINDWALKTTACLTNTDYDIVRDEILGKRYSDYEVQ